MDLVNNKMGSKAVFPLLVEMSIPPVISMLIQSMYNIVDSIFVARLGEDALTAVSLAYPMQNIVLSVAVGLGVSVNAAIARSIGASKQDEADEAATHGVFLAIFHSILFIIIGLFFTKKFITMFTDNEHIIRLGCDYTYIVICLSSGVMFHVLIEKIFQSVGNMVKPMIMQGVGAILNIILDPIFIFGMFGVPAMGVMGAAIATVIGQFTACIISVVLFIKNSYGINIRIKDLKLDWRMVKQLYSVAVPSAFMMSVTSLMAGGVNKILAGFSQTAVAVMGVYFKLQMFVYMPVNGVIQGMRPIVSYNYGAGDIKRMNKTITVSAIVSLCIMVLGTVIFMLLPYRVLNLFNADDKMITVGVSALRIISTGFIVSTVSIIFSGVFEALNRGMESFIVSFVRQLVITIPLAALLSQFWELNGVWVSFPLSEMAAAIVSALLFFRMVKNLE